MSMKHSTNFCRWCGTRLSLDLALLLLCPGEALRVFLAHVQACSRFPPHRRAKWKEHARRLLVKVN